MGTRDDVEQIIETIKQHNVLYDNTLPYHKKKLREVTWEKIAEMYNMDVPSLKAKWKNLRDTYKKHLRSVSGDTKVSDVHRHWHWSEALEFLRPFMINRGANTELVYCDENDDTHVTENPDNTLQIKLEQDNNFASDSETFECLLKQKPKVKKKRKNPLENFASDSDNTECMVEQPNRLRKRSRLLSTKEANEKCKKKRPRIQ